MADDHSKFIRRSGKGVASLRRAPSGASGADALAVTLPAIEDVKSKMATRSSLSSAANRTATWGATQSQHSAGESSERVCSSAAESRESGRMQSYHSPKVPPEPRAMVEPLPLVNVAREYDPTAHTRRGLRKGALPPLAPPMFGVDRLLVWGLVLGGIFVAFVFVVVSRFAFSGVAAERQAVAKIDDFRAPNFKAKVGVSANAQDDSLADRSALSSTASSSSVATRKLDSRGATVRSTTFARKKQVTRAVSDEKAGLWIE